MNVITAEPMSMIEWANITKGKGLIEDNGRICRILNYSAGQVVDAEDVIEYKGMKFGIKARKYAIHGYSHIAFRVE